MKDERNNWIELYEEGKITLNGLELLMSCRHECYKRQFSKEHLNTHVHTAET